jgi:hypothetical protein
MSLKGIGRNKTLVHLIIFVFILLLSQQGIPAGSRVDKHEDGPSFRVKKAISNSLPASAQDFGQLLREARKLYDEMDYEGAVQKLRAAEKLARTAMQKADVYFYLSLAYYATLGGRDRGELLSTLEKVFVFDYQREPDPELCPSGYIEVFNELKASYGAIRILSQPDGADVYINRSLAGKTPLTIGAKAGQINILLKRGKVEKQDQLEVTAGDLISSPIYDLAGKKGKFPIALVLGGLALAGGAAALALKGGGGGNGGGGATTGSIQVNSSPTGAKVYLDGADTGEVTNTTLTNVAAGSHTVKLTKDGYSDKEQSVSVSAGQTATVDLTLTKDTITVTQPAAGTTWIFGSSVTISWQVSAGTSLQSEPVAAGPPGAGLQNEHLYNARFLRASRDLADLRGVGSGKFGREGRGKSPGRGESIREMQGSLGRSAALASASPRHIPGGGFPLSLNRIPNSRLGRQTDDTARVLAISKVKIELYKGGTLTSTIVQETDNDGSHSWQVPTTLAGGSDYKVRVSCTSDTSVYGESGNFTIASSAGTIKVTQPASGAVWKKSLAYFIKWTSSLSGNVKIELYKGDSLALTIKESARDDGEYQWTVPVSLADGSDYNILVTSVEKPTVSGRSANFTITHWYEFMTKWGSGGSGNGQFNSPWGIAVDNSGNVYVVDTGNNRVQKFTSSGAYVTKWGSAGSGNGQFNEPYGIAVDNSGFLYVVDRKNVRVQQFSLTGTFLVQWTTDPNDWGSDPHGIAIYGSGILYITDFSNHHVSRFTTTGALLSHWGSGGNTDGSFVQPYGVTVDQSEYIYVADTSNHRVQKFNSSGTFLVKWGSQGSADGQFSNPKGIAIDGSGRVHVVDSDNHRIQVFTSSGSFIEKWGSQGSADGQFSNPVGVAFDSAGHIYVVDQGNHRIQKFRRIG